MPCRTSSRCDMQLGVHGTPFSLCLREETLLLPLHTFHLAAFELAEQCFIQPCSNPGMNSKCWWEQVCSKRPPEGSSEKQRLSAEVHMPISHGLESHEREISLSAYSSGCVSQSPLLTLSTSCNAKHWGVQDKTPEERRETQISGCTTIFTCCRACISVQCKVALKQPWGKGLFSCNLCG